MNPVSFGSVVFGAGAPLAFILGPCAMESREHALETAAAIAEIAAKVGVGAVYKTSFDKANRTSSASPRGVGLDAALGVFEEIRTRVGLPVITDVHEPWQCAPVAEAVDALQIPAFLCRQTDLLRAAAATGKPVNVKKGQFVAPWDMGQALAKLREVEGFAGATLTERGACFGYNTLVVDMRALVWMRAEGAPIIFDATHAVQAPGGMGERSGGDRTLAPPLARAAAAVGVDGIFMETHPDPDSAPSDGPNMIPFAELESVLRALVAVDGAARAAEAA